MNTLQTGAPVERLGLFPTNRAIVELYRLVNDGEATLDPPYQRGPAWNEAQQRMLIKSLMSETPIPALILNQRRHAAADEPFYAVIDGKQRILALVAWFRSELAVPASWFPADQVLRTEDTPDGPYVRMDGLDIVAQRYFRNIASVPVVEARVSTVEEEAEIYLRVNGGGTPQTDADLDNARRVRSGSARIVEVADDDVFGKAYLAGYDDEVAGRADPQREEHDDAYSAGANAADQDRHDQTPGARRDPDRDIP